MSTYVLMKILESTPDRYDLGIRMLTFGSLEGAYDRLTDHLHDGQKVLDIGCGTGALTLRAAQKNVHVRGIDVNAHMLEIAQKRIDEAGLSQQTELREMGVAELGGEAPESYDAVMSGLCFSELSDNELDYTLRETYRILKPGGLILFAVETIPQGIHKKLLHWLIKVPLIVITYVVTQTTTRAVKHLPEKVEDAGFLIDAIRRSPLESFIELRGRKPEGGTA